VIIKSISANQRPRRPARKAAKRKSMKVQRPTTSPFRWTISRREQLGGLVEGLHNRPPLDAGFVSFLRNAAARVLALSNGADLAFVGRTLENFFDYLSGAFSGLEDAPHLHLVQFSLRWTERGGAKALPPKKVAALFDYFTEEGVDAAAIARARRPLALVDFVAYGGAMESLVGLLHLQASRNGVDWNAVQRRLRIIGLRPRTKNSPNTWRWQQHQNWLELSPDADIKNVSAEPEYLFHIANAQPKVTESFHLGRWDEPQDGAPEPDVPTRHAIAMAADLFDLGRSAKSAQRSLRDCRARRKCASRRPAPWRSSCGADNQRPRVWFYAAGRVASNTAPSALVSASRTSPPCARASSREMARPNPAPPARSAETNG
jgi:hypothetical protein